MDDNDLAVAYERGWREGKADALAPIRALLEDSGPVYADDGEVSYVPLNRSKVLAVVARQLAEIGSR